MLQWCRHVGKGRAVSQGTRLALNERDVVLPVVERLFAGEAAPMAGDQRVVRDDVDLLR